MRVQDVLAKKGDRVATIGADATVAHVISDLAGHRVGALVVSPDGRTVRGIVSERDVVHALDAYGADVLDMPVSAIMTADVQTCAPADEVRELARVMTDKRFRHMPVLVDGELAGIVSIGDIVKIRVDELETEQEQLMGYIASAG
jgi:CBS domain-containing protein